MKTKDYRGDCHPVPFSRRTVWFKGVVYGAVYICAILMELTVPLAVAAAHGPGSGHEPWAAAWFHVNWGKTFGGMWTDEATSIQPTDDDGFILAGRTTSFVDNPGYENAWILKLGSLGEVEWEKSFGEELWDSIRSIQQTVDGGYVAAGTRYPPGGSQEAWVMKLKADGEVDWQYTYGRNVYYDGAWSIQQTADKGFIVLGWTQSYALGGERGAWVLKLTDSGQIEWQKFFDGGSWDFLFSARQTADGGYILAGGSYALSDIPWYSDVWVIKLFPDGTVDWQKTFGGDADDVAYSILQTADGGYALSCWTSSFGSGGGDVWVLRIDEYGNILWQKSYGGEWSDVPLTLKLTSDGGYLVAGYTASYGRGNYDGWALKLASNGKIEWQRTFGGLEADGLSDIEESSTGYVATGYTRSFGAGEEDIWVLRFSPVGPGAFLMNPISGRSTAVAVSTNGTEKFVVGNSLNIEGASALSLATAATSAAEQTYINAFPGKSWLFRLQGMHDRLNSFASWPVVQALKGGPIATTDTPWRAVKTLHFR